MKENNSFLFHKLSIPKTKLSNTESITSFNSNFSTNEKDNNYIKMNGIIQKIMDYQTQNEGRVKDDEISFLIKKRLYEMNKKINNIMDDKNNTFLHILTKTSNYYPLKIICDTYYILLDDENLFFKWFFSENKENLTALDIASIIGNKRILSYLFSILSRTNKSILKFDDINIKKNTVFHYSAKNNQYYSILFWYEKLQQYFPKTKIFDTKNSHNLTPLHYACFDNSFECVQLLIDLGADVNAVDVNGKSVLTYAINSNNLNIIHLLILNGADYNKKDSEGKTAYDYSKDGCDLNIQSILNKKHKINLINNNKNSYEIIQLLLIFSFLIFLFLSRLIDIENYKDLFNYKCIFFYGLIFLGISLIFVVISLLMISHFLCCIKHKQYKKSNKRNLLKLYERYNTDICIKCLKRKREKTYHCITCGLCIEEWIFHCYWLNTCITKDNIKKYKLLFISIIILLSTKIISLILFILFAIFDNDEYKKKNNIFITIFYINNNDDDNKYEEKNKKIKNYIFIPVFIFFAIFYFILTISIIVKYFKRKKERKIIKDNQNYHNLTYGLVDIEEEDKKDDGISSSVGASLGD